MRILKFDLLVILFVPLLALGSCKKIEIAESSEGKEKGYDFRSAVSGKSVKLSPLFLAGTGHRGPKGLIKTTRPANSFAGAIPVESLFSAVTRCAVVPVVFHPGGYHSDGFITFPSSTWSENRNHDLDVDIVRCVQRMSEYDFVASVIEPYKSEGPSDEVQGDWALAEIVGDITPFRSLHAQKN